MRAKLSKRGAVDHELIWGLLGAAVLCVAVLAQADRLLARTGYVCAFRQLTGLPCPTCGATRAFCAAGRGRIADAVRVNPLATVGFLALVLYVPYALGSVVLGTRRLRLVGTTRKSRRAIYIALGVLFLANWAYMILTGV